MKTKLNHKIIFHWVFILSLIGLLIYYIENKSILYTIVSFLIMTLIFNRTTYLKLKSDSLLITKTNFLFIPTSKVLFNINDIKSLSLTDYRDIDVYNSRKYAEFEAVVIVEIITGIFFYKPNYKLVVYLTQNKRIELEINSRKKDIIKIIMDLQKLIIKRHNSLLC